MNIRNFSFNPLTNVRNISVYAFIQVITDLLKEVCFTEVNFIRSTSTHKFVSNKMVDQNTMNYILTRLASELNISESQLIKILRPLHRGVGDNNEKLYALELDHFYDYLQSDIKSNYSQGQSTLSDLPSYFDQKIKNYSPGFRNLARDNKNNIVSRNERYPMIDIPLFESGINLMFEYFDLPPLTLQLVEDKHRWGTFNLLSDKHIKVSEYDKIVQRLVKLFGLPNDVLDIQSQGFNQSNIKDSNGKIDSVPRQQIVFKHIYKLLSQENVIEKVCHWQMLRVKMHHALLRNREVRAAEQHALAQGYTPSIFTMFRDISNIKNDIKSGSYIGPFLEQAVAYELQQLSATSPYPHLFWQDYSEPGFLMLSYLNRVTDKIEHMPLIQLGIISPIDEELLIRKIQIPNDQLIKAIVIAQNVIKDFLTQRYQVQDTTALTIKFDEKMRDVSYNKIDVTNLNLSNISKNNR